MIDKKQISDILKKISKHERGVRDTKMMHPSREWLIGVSIGFLIFIASAVWSVYTYTSNRDVSGSVTTESNAEQSLYKEGLVNEALRKISEREKVFASFSKGTTLPDTEEIATTTIEVTPEEEVEIEPEEIEQPKSTTTEDLNIILN